MAFTVEHVKILLQRDVVTELENIKVNIIAKIKKKKESNSATVCLLSSKSRSLCLDSLLG